MGSARADQREASVNWLERLARLLGTFIFFALWIGATYHYLPGYALPGLGGWALLVLSSAAALQLALAFGIG